MPSFELIAGSSVEEIGVNLRDMLPGFFPSKTRRRSLPVSEAFEHLTQEEAQKLIDMDGVAKAAIHRVEQAGIIFVDEIDKIAGREGAQGPDVSREGVQRDILPIVEGTTVNSKYGMVRTDHILFVAAGAFHVSKPSDLIPELQGRFPIRVELEALGRDEFVRILTEPKNALIKQYMALMATEGVTLEFTPDAIDRIAELATLVNERTENIGARRLHTVLERLLDDVSFHAPELGGRSILIDAQLRRSDAGRHRRGATTSRGTSCEASRGRGRLRPSSSSACPAARRRAARRDRRCRRCGRRRRASATCARARRDDHADAALHGAGDEPRRIDAGGDRSRRDLRARRRSKARRRRRRCSWSTPSEPDHDHRRAPGRRARRRPRTRPPDTRLDAGRRGDRSSRTRRAGRLARRDEALRRRRVRGTAARRRSAIVSVPLQRVPPAPGALAFEHDEKTLKVTWTAPAAALAYRRVRGHARHAAEGDAAERRAHHDAGVHAAGRARPRAVLCVADVEAAGRVTLEGPVGEPLASRRSTSSRRLAPTRLVAQPVEGGVDLVWSAVGRRPISPATASCAARAQNAISAAHWRASWSRRRHSATRAPSPA